MVQGERRERIRESYALKPNERQRTVHVTLGSQQASFDLALRSNGRQQPDQRRSAFLREKLFFPARKTGLLQRIKHGFVVEIAGYFNCLEKTGGLLDSASGRGGTTGRRGRNGTIGCCCGTTGGWGVSAGGWGGPTGGSNGTIGVRAASTGVTGKFDLRHAWHCFQSLLHGIIAFAAAKMHTLNFDGLHRLVFRAVIGAAFIDRGSSLLSPK